MRVLKKAGFFLLVMLMSVGVYLIITDDADMRDSVLRKTLGLFGEELLAMVPEGPQKAKLEKQYADFMQRAEMRQISARQVEQVAAVILNMKNMQDSVDAQIVIDALNLPDLNTERHADKRSRPPRVEKLSDRELAGRLEKMREFQNSVHRMYEQDTSLSVLKKKLYFVADSGIRVVIDDSVQNIVKTFDKLGMEQIIESLEQEKMIRWYMSEKEIERMLENMHRNLEKLHSEMNIQDYKDIPKDLSIPDADSIKQWLEQLPDSLKKPDEYSDSRVNH